MVTKWSTNQRKQNCSTRRWRPLGINRRSKASSSFIRTSVVLLLSFPIIAKPLEQELIFKGPSNDEDLRHDRRTDEILPSDFSSGSDVKVEAPGKSDGFSTDGEEFLDQPTPFQLLHALSQEADKDFSGRTKMETKRKWSNNEYLRVWGKRDVRMKPVEDDSHIETTHGRQFSADTLVIILSPGYRQGENTGTSALIDRIMNKKDQSDETILPLDDVTGLSKSNSGDRQWDVDHGITLAGLRPKRFNENGKWEKNSLRIWGKRDGDDDVRERLMVTNMRRRKWENLPLRVWGK